MGVIFKNILAILLYIWAIPFQLLLFIIVVISLIPFWLCRRCGGITFNENQKQWKITHLFEVFSDKLQSIIGL